MTICSWGRLGLCVSVTLAVLNQASPGFSADPVPRPIRTYVGTYTTGAGEGIYRFDFNPATGSCSPPVLVARCANPSFLAFNPTEDFLYAVNEVADDVPDAPGQKTGWVTAYQVDQSTGDLKKLNTQSSGGAIPCYVTIDSNSRNALVANYTGGSVACIPLHPDGSLSTRTNVIKHGRTDAERKASRAHSIILSPDERFAIAADAGIDHLMIYRFDAEAGKLIPHSPHLVSTGPGSAPRHVTFHPNGRWIVNNNEANFKINAYDYNAEHAQLTHRQTLSTLDEGTPPKGTTAEVLIHSGGEFAYVSNRGPDSLARYLIASDGKLTFEGTTPTQGKTPRNFRIDPTGHYLLAANQDSSTIVVFRIDQGNGALTPTGEIIQVPNPVCIKFATK